MHSKIFKCRKQNQLKEGKNEFICRQNQLNEWKKGPEIAPFFEKQEEVSVMAIQLGVCVMYDVTQTVDSMEKIYEKLNQLEYLLKNMEGSSKTTPKTDETMGHNIR